MAEVTVGKTLFLFRSSPGLPSLSEQGERIQEIVTADSSTITKVDISGAHDIEEVFELIVRSNVAEVICFRLDVLSQLTSSFERIFFFIQSLLANGVHFVSVVDGVDTESSATAFIQALSESWIALKSNRKKEIAKISVSKAKARGTKVGRKKIRDDAMIRDLRKAGLTIGEVATKLDVSQSAVKRAISEMRKDVSPRKEDRGL